MTATNFIGNGSQLTNMPVSTAQQNALDLKANLAGGNSFTGEQIFNASETTVKGNLTIDGESLQESRVFIKNGSLIVDNGGNSDTVASFDSNFNKTHIAFKNNGGQNISKLTLNSSNIFEVDKNFQAPAFIGDGSQLTNIPQNYTPPHKTYTAIMTQDGVNAPSATVVYNNVDAGIVWERSSPGVYYVKPTTPNGTTFPPNKVIILTSPGPLVPANPEITATASRLVTDGSGNYWVEINTSLSGVLQDNIIDSGYNIEIKVYS
jgi:hypothetical protein